MTDKSTAIASYLASLFGIIAGMTVDDWLSILGYLSIPATFAVNWVYRHYQHNREERKAEYERLRTEHLIGRKLPLKGKDDE